MSYALHHTRQSLQHGHNSPHRPDYCDACLGLKEVALLEKSLQRAAYLVTHLTLQVDEFTGVIGPGGEREDDYIRLSLLEEAENWRKLAGDYTCE